MVSCTPSSASTTQARTALFDRHRLEVEALDAPVVGERRLVLLVAQQRQLVERLARHAAFARHRLGGVHHRLRGVGVGGKVVEHPVLGGRAAADRAWPRIREQRPIAGAVRRDDERARHRLRLDLQCRRHHARHRRGASLLHVRSADARHAEPGRDPWHGVEAARLRDRGAEHDLIDALRLAAALRERIARDRNGNVEARHVGQPALPTHERR
ncbi:MAG TPA: hypothetical protein VF107_06535 [Burkholderiaceae bacterium]